MFGPPDSVVARQDGEGAGDSDGEAEAFELKMTPRPEDAARSQPEEPPRIESAVDRIEALVVRDPGDDDLRQQYLQAVDDAGEHLRGANTLARAAGANEAAIRERVWFDAATLYLQEAELPQARSAFMQAVLAGAGGKAGLAAAKRVLDLESEPGDPDVVAPALALIAKAHPDSAAREDAARRLLALHLVTPQENARLTTALHALGESPEEAIAWVASLRERDPDRAVALCRAALESDPSAPGWLGQLDQWLGDDEPLEERVARYEAALAHETTPGRRLSLLRTTASIRRVRHDLTLRTARSLSRQGDRAEAVAMCRELLDDPSASPATLQAVAEIAHDEEDNDLYRATLELMVRTGTADAKRRALERLGDFQFAQLRDPQAAAESWRPAALMCDASPAEQAQAQALFERVLEALPDDRDAALRLSDIYRLSSDWAKLPRVLRVLIRTEPGEGASSRLLLDLEKSAIGAGAIEEYASLLDEVIAHDGGGSTERARVLKKARARALSSDASRQEQASFAHRELVETFAFDEDLRDFEAFIESRASAQERHRDRRWVYGWRADREAKPAKVLLDWARAEDEFGETDTAIAVYTRLSEVEPGRRDALEALCRLKLHAGDFEGGLVALRSLRDAGNETERRAVILRMARLLLEEMGRPAEAALALAPLFGVVPPIAAAHQMIQRTLADAAARGPVIERLEQLASDADPATRLRVYEFLMKAREETSAMSSSRLRWIQRVVELTPDRTAALQAAVEGAVELPDNLELWESAETLARSLGRPDLVSRAYRDVIVDGQMPSHSIETLARRMVAFEGEHGGASAHLVEALLRTLELSPGARWAIDRVKLVLGSEARWDELFRLYDRAIATAADDRTRAALLDEAAFAAKDLAGQPDRAIAYLEAIRGYRPEDAAVDGALERLYEKQGRTSALIALLDDRLGRCTGFQHREVLRKMASLWLELGSAEQAVAIVDRMLSGSAPVAEVSDLLERAAADLTSPGEPPAESLVAAQKRAIALLRAHYEAADRIDDVVRMAERELALAASAGAAAAEERARCVRDLVGLRLAAAQRSPGEAAFAQVIPRIQADVAGDVPLAKIAFEAVLQRALVAWKQPASPARDDAAEGTWRAIHILEKLLVESGKGEAALNLLTRCSRLPFERSRRREFVREAALVCADRLADPTRAIRTFGELFEEDGGDEVAAKSLQRFSTLLEKAGELSRLATLWETQSLVHEKSGKATEQRACWERAARLWERQDELDKAVAAYGRAGALGSQAAFEALAKIHTAREAWADAAEALEWLVTHSPAPVRGLRALQLADACVALGDRSRARACLEGAMAAGIEVERAEQVPERLLQLYREDGAWRPLARLLAVLARRPVHPERRLAWLREASNLHWLKLDEAAEAATLLELAVSWYPQDAALRPALADVVEALGQWEKAAAVLRDQLGLYRDQRSKERALVHHRLARALVRAGGNEGALAELRLAAEMHPSNAAILYDLGRTAIAADQLDLAESTYRALLLALHHSMDDDAAEDGPSGPHRAEVFVELSEIAARKGETARAIDLVDSAVDAAIESGEDPKRFEAPLAARARNDLLARAIERRVERAATLAARASALDDLATLWAQGLGRAAGLGARIARHAERMGRELEHEGLTDAAAWTALASAHRSFGDETARLATVQRRTALLESAIPKLEAGDERNRLRVELATVLLEDPARTSDAVALLTGALQDAPGDGEAAARLADALERTSRFAELVVLLERQLAATPPANGASTGATGEARWRLAKAFERAGRPKDALPVYESVLDGVDPSRLGALVERLEELGSDRLADGLEQMLAAGGDPALAERLLALRDRAGDAAGARRALELGFKAQPGNVAFFRRLVEAYRLADDPGGTLRLLDPAVAARPNDTDLLLLRASARESLGDDDGALFDLETAAVADARHIEPLLALHERVLSRLVDGTPGRALPTSDASTRDGRTEALARQGRTADAYAIRVVDVLLHAKRFVEGRRELDRVLARNPDQGDALERMAALHGVDGAWDRAIETYRRLLPTVNASGDKERLVSVVLALADACERAGDAGAARDALEQALAGAPESHELTQRLERVCEITGDLARLANLLVSHAERASGASERMRLFVRAGTILLDADPAAAAALASRAREADGESHEAILLWAAALRLLGNASEAIPVLHETTTRARGKRTPLLARLHLESAKAHLAVDEIVEAFDSLKAGFNLDWRNTELAMLLGLVAIDLDDEKLAERALSGLPVNPARDTPDATLQASAFYRLALMAQARGDRGKARRMAARAVAVDPGHAPARALLDQIEPPGGSPANRSGPRPAINPH
jgi:golgin subfamily B member 1